MRPVAFLVIAVSFMLLTLSLVASAKQPEIKGEIPFGEVKDELIPYLRLSSGGR